jgi:hypothetical protein
VQFSGGELAAEVAKLIRQSIPLQIEPLTREIRMAGAYSHFDAAVREKFIARLA